MNSLIVKNDKGQLVLSSEVEDVLDIIEGQRTDINDRYEKIKSAIMNAMIDNDLKNAKVGKYKLSIRVPKNEWVFDEERFLREENKDIIAMFMKTETSYEEAFDFEKLKSQYPDVYKDCLSITKHETTHVDEHELWLKLRNVWEKYATECVSTKNPTISIKKEGE